MVMIPPARGGQAKPVKPRVVKPKAPKAPRVKPLDANQVATSNAMSAFRVALRQLQDSTPAVDPGRILQPYQAASTAAGQLGTGLQQAVTTAGQAAQQQYGAGLAEAQKSAAQFGISAGAGAQPTALQNNGTQLIAQQTQAQAAAAPQAANAWQNLLLRTGAAKVGEAEAARQQGLTSAQQALSGTIPSAIANEKELGFRQRASDANNAYLQATLDAKGRDSFRDWLLGTQKTQASAKTAEANTSIKKQALAQKTKNDAAKLRISQQALALKQRASTAQATGLKGVSTAVKALSGTSSKAGTRKVAKGWLVQARPWDEDLGQFTGGIEEIHVPDKRKAPAGYKIVKGTSAKTNWADVPTAGGSAGVTRATWDTQYRALLAQNPGQAAAVRALLGPRPKK